MAGEAAKNYATGTNNFETGASIIKNPSEFGSDAIRNLSAPASDGRTLESEEQYGPMIQNAIETQSEVDEHAGAGIYDKAFYELATTNNWSTKKAFEVFVNANKLYWKPDTTFDSGACGVLQAAQDQNYNVQDVAYAFDTVGVDYSQCYLQ